MKLIRIIALAGCAAMTAGSLAQAQIAIDLSSARRTAYSAKKHACEARAKNMKFGIHRLKRNRWVKDCIAGAH